MDPLLIPVHGGVRPAGASAHPDLSPGDRECAGHEDQREHCRGRAVERRPVAHEDRAGEGVVAQQGHRAEVRERVGGHQQRAGGHRRAQVREGDPAEHLPAGQAEGAPHVLRVLVGPAQRGGDGQEHVRVRAEAEDQHRPPEALGSHSGHPCVGGHVARHRQRKGQRRPPEASAAQVRALDEEGQAHPHDAGEGGDGGDERQRVREQFANPALGEDPQQLGPAGVAGAEDQVQARDEGHQHDQERPHPQREARQVRTLDGRGDGAQISPTFLRSSCVSASESRSLRSTPAWAEASTGARSKGLVMPATTGYSAVSSAK